MHTSQFEDSLLEVSDLSVNYVTDDGVVYAVNGIGFSVSKGMTLGIVGETGAGKTTTALSIMGLLPERIGRLCGGSIKFNGLELTELSFEQMRAIRGKEISMIFQDPMTSLNPVHTVSQQIAEVLELHNHEGLNKIQIAKKVDEILSLVGISPTRKSEYPHQFSGGMKQRVVIAMAIACQPKLLVADEPTTALDVTIQAQVLDMIDRLKDELETSVILITHDLGIVAQACDTVAVMYAGEIVEYGTIDDIYTGDRHHPYTKGLFGSIPSLTEKSARLSPIVGLMPDPMSLPQGCKFHPRCSLAMDICKTDEPPYVCQGEHRIKCHYYATDETASEEGNSVV